MTEFGLNFEALFLGAVTVLIGSVDFMGLGPLNK